MKIIFSLAIILVSSYSIAQTSCYTNCMADQQNNPSAGQICTTTCNETKPSSKPLDFSGLTGGIKAFKESRDRKAMISKARADCSNGIQASCDWLKQNNIYP